MRNGLIYQSVSVPESLLLEDLAEGNKAAFTELYRKYQPRLYQYILPFAGSMHAAEEVVQEVLFKLWARRRTLLGIVSLEQYLLRGTKNQLLDRVKKELIEQKYISRLTAPVIEPDSVESANSFKE